jgi:alkaline phosphatase D
MTVADLAVCDTSCPLPDSTLFEHGVASGDPLTDRVMIWTQIGSEDESVPVSWKVARDPQLSDVVVSGETTAEAEHDHTVHVDVTGLEPGVTYHYGFSAAGEDSPVARTWTLRSDAERLRFATCSCAKHNAGFFNAYARIAARDDLDFLLHLGDYIYEMSNIPAKGQTPGADIGRDFDPLGECRTLDEYRARYRQYHRDPDVQALHLAIPIIPTLDDHELADGAWAGGSDAHDPKLHGPWDDRKAAAFRARWEWLPARPPDPADLTQAFRQIKVGDLADIFLLDIRSRRDQPALEPEMSDPGRTMLGAAQRDWLMGALDSSTAAWRLVGSPSIIHRTWSENPSELLETAMLKLKLMDEDREGPDEDQWDGYPAEKDALLQKFDQLDDVVVLSADIHVSVAAQLSRNGSPVAPEITAPSLTSQNLDEKLKREPRDETIVASEKAFVEALDHVEWCEFSGHGYVVCDVDRERLRAEWWLVDGVLERLPGEGMAAAYEVRRGSPALNPG